MKIGIINGPNLDRLGKREPGTYGSSTLADLEARIKSEAGHLNVEVACFQSNHEGAIVEQIAAWQDANWDALILNLGAYTHTSVAIRDALAASQLPAVEVHISNVHARESFRHQSYIAELCLGVVAGLGFEGYLAALRFLAQRVD